MSNKRNSGKMSIYEKNQIINMVITDIGTDGEGIGKIDGFTFFVKDAVPGDEIEARVMKVKKQYGYARLERVIRPSSFRVESPCQCSKACGGCQIMEMDYKKQLEFKNNKVRNNLIRIGEFDQALIDQIMEPIVGMNDDGKAPLRYRNKAQYPVGTDKNGQIITGFYAGRTHSIIKCEDCKLGSKINSLILNQIIDFMSVHGISPYKEETGEGLVRHILIRNGHSTGEIMICLVINGESIPGENELCQILSGIDGVASISVSVNTDRTNVIMGNTYRTLWGKDTIKDIMKIRRPESDFTSFYGEGITYEISPLSFYQVNPIQVEKLYGVAVEYADLSGNEEVWDLCCGIGTITLSMAGMAGKVHGIEIVPQAIDDAKNNAIINGIDNADFICAAAEKYLPEHASEIKADVIVMDPPRKGMDEEALKVVLQTEPEKIVYVSCDSATLARDLKYLCAGGYQLERVRAVDMFPHTVHVETVILMSRKDK